MTDRSRQIVAFGTATAGAPARRVGGYHAHCRASDRFRFLEKESQMLRRDFSRAVPETFAMVDGGMVDGQAYGRG
jgi:hypothetical protein